MLLLLLVVLLLLLLLVLVLVLLICFRNVQKVLNTNVKRLYAIYEQIN